ncbi:DUF4169 family protein [Algirhabdus cladophorae]|uniref:DUF4169 family protein n=1 Tax=Algirhabdus cladophorae TaxID=3377108 RepID=UPI003B847BC4
MSLINLNKARKAKTRALKKARADTNAVSFGRTKAEKQRTQTENDRALRKIDAHKRDESP